MEIKATEEDVARWREACELEVEAGKSEIEERDKVVNNSVRYKLFLIKVSFPNQLALLCSGHPSFLFFHFSFSKFGVWLRYLLALMLI